MAEGYQKFIDFDWSDERWQNYLNGLYPPPNNKQILKFKKKWYKKTVDPNFDDTYEPGASASSSSAGTASGAATGGTAAASSGPLPTAAYSDGSRWASMGSKTTICFVAYTVALTMAVGSVAGVFPPYQALVVLVGAFVLEILAKYGLKFKTDYLHSVVLDDVGVMPIMALTLLTPGLHPAIRTFSLIPPFLTALLTYAQICKNFAKLPKAMRDFFAPLAEISARYQVMQGRAHAEVMLGFLLIGGVFAVRVAPISALLFWNFMMMRYMMSAWTQASFRRIDDALSPVLGKIPGISHLYAFIKKKLYSFVDPESRSAGHLCTIL